MLLDDFPLALVQASGAIRYLDISISDYCTMYKKEYEDLQKEEEELGDKSDNRDSSK